MDEILEREVGIDPFSKGAKLLASLAQHGGYMTVEEILGRGLIASDKGLSVLTFLGRKENNGHGPPLTVQRQGKNGPLRSIRLAGWVKQLLADECSTSPCEPEQKPS